MIQTSKAEKSDDGISTIELSRKYKNTHLINFKTNLLGECQSVRVLGC